MADDVYSELRQVCFEAAMEGLNKKDDVVKVIDGIVVKYYYATDQLKIKYKGGVKTELKDVLKNLKLRNDDE